jgi:hypothetical protein
MAQVIYIGRHGVVLVPLPSGAEATARWGEPFETSDEHAAQLLQQPDNWKRAPKSAAKKGSDT